MFSGSTAKWLPSGLKTDGVCQLNASGVMSSSALSLAGTRVTGTLPINKGGTGQTIANDALNALLPSQTGNAGEFLTTDGTNASWAAAGSSSGWALTGNAGTTAGTNFVGTTDAQDVVIKRNNTEIARAASGGLIATNIAGSTSASGNLVIGSTTDATKGAITIGQSYKEMAAGGIAVGPGATSATTSSGAFHVKSGGSYTSAIILEGPSSAFNAGSKAFVYMDDAALGVAPVGASVFPLLMRTDGVVQSGDTNNSLFGHMYGTIGAGGSSSTDPTAMNKSSAAVAIQNTSGTANNFSALAFVPQENVDGIFTSALIGRHTDHTDASVDGQLEVWTTAASVKSRKMVVGNTGTVTMDAYGTGIAHFNSSGVISSSSVTNSDMANMTDGTIKANISGSSAAPSDVTIDDILDDYFGTTQGSIIYRGASAWTALSPGTNGHFLQTQGAGANPQWAAASGGSSTLTQSKKSANYTLTNSDDVIYCDSGAGSISITLHAASTATSKEYKIKNINTSPCYIVPSGSDLLMGSNTSLELAPGSTSLDGPAIGIIPDGGSLWSIF